METFIVVAIIGAIIIAAALNQKDEARRLEQLRQAYIESLKGGNKRLALEAGRAYYCALRKDKALTMYDEQAITNDLSTMSDFAGSSQIQ